MCVLLGESAVDFASLDYPSFIAVRNPCSSNPKGGKNA
jgi:hypothetical protein